MNILIVDDDKSTRELLTELLKVNGHRVVCVENGLIALDALKSGVPDLIVSDILMPGMDGFEFCQRIRSDKRLTDIPFVLLSGAFLDKKDSEFAKSIGVSHFLPKPIDPMDFTQVIEALLIQRKKKTKTNKSPRKKNARAAEDQAKLVTDKLYHKVLELDEEKASSLEMEKKLRLISDSLPELMAEIDTNNCYVYVNEMYAKAYGSTQALITGKNIREVVEEAAAASRSMEEQAINLRNQMSFFDLGNSNLIGRSASNQQIASRRTSVATRADADRAHLDHLKQGKAKPGSKETSEWEQF